MNSNDIKSTQCCFINTEQTPIKEEHICYYTKSSKDEISLFEVKKVYYLHPDTDEAMVFIMVDDKIKTVKKSMLFDASPMILLESAQMNMKSRCSDNL